MILFRGVATVKKQYFSASRPTCVLGLTLSAILSAILGAILGATLIVSTPTFANPVNITTSHLVAPFATLPKESLKVSDLYYGGNVVGVGHAPYSIPLGSSYYQAKSNAQDKLYSALKGITIAGSLTMEKGVKLLDVPPHRLLGNPILCHTPYGSGISHNFTVVDICLSTSYAKIATQILSSPAISQGIFNILPAYKGDTRYALDKAASVSNYDSIVIDARGLSASISILPRVVTTGGAVVFTPLALNSTILNQGRYYTFQTQGGSFVGNGKRYRRPLYIKASAIRNNSDFVVSENSARLIISTNRKYGMLGDGSVFFIID